MRTSSIIFASICPLGLSLSLEYLDIHGMGAHLEFHRLLGGRFQFGVVKNRTKFIRNLMCSFFNKNVLEYIV